MPAPRPSTAATRERLLRAAERCFTDHGYEGSSLRRITRLAKVNLAAVNYHFSSKREMWLEVMQRRLLPLQAERTRLLAQLRAETPAGTPLPLEKVCDAMFLPIADAFSGSNGADATMARMLAALAFHEPQHLRKELNRRTLNHFWRTFYVAMHEAMPEMSPEEMDWKFYFLMSSMLGALAWQGRQVGLERKLDSSDLKSMLRRLSTFVCGGLRAVHAATADGEKI